MRLRTIVAISGLLLSASSAFWYLVGWHAHRARVPDHAATLDEARRALAAEDWERAAELAGVVERGLSPAQEIQRRAEEMMEDRRHAAEMAAAAAAGRWDAALEAYEAIGEDSLYRPRYTALREQVHGKLADETMTAARRLFAVHDCKELRERLDDTSRLAPAQSAEVATLLTRCAHERTDAEVVRDAEAGELEDGDRARLLAMTGAERRRALVLLGNDACGRNRDGAQALWRSLEGADRQAFAHGCALEGTALPLSR